jgi:formyltetrahydrofolate hydrolase
MLHLPAEPLKPEMKALRSSHDARYSLESKEKKEKFFIILNQEIKCARTLILAWNHESLHIDILLPHQIP